MHWDQPGATPRPTRPRAQAAPGKRPPAPPPPRPSQRRPAPRPSANDRHAPEVPITGRGQPHRRRGGPLAEAKLPWRLRSGTGESGSAPRSLRHRSVPYGSVPRGTALHPTVPQRSLRHRSARARRGHDGVRRAAGRVPAVSRPRPRGPPPAAPHLPRREYCGAGPQRAPVPARGLARARRAAVPPQGEPWRGSTCRCQGEALSRLPQLRNQTQGTREWALLLL